MNKVKTQIDKDFGEFIFDGNIYEILNRYKKRKRRTRSAAAFVCVAATGAIIAVQLSGTGLPRLSLTAYALESSDKIVLSEEKQALFGEGVTQTEDRTVYDMDDVAMTGNTDDGVCILPHTVVDPAIIKFDISGRNIESFDVSCGKNGIIFREGSEFEWTPDCEKFTADLEKRRGIDCSELPSDMEKDRQVSEGIHSLLRAADNFTEYFGDTLKLEVKYKDGSIETISAEITLDETGKYYIQLREKEDKK